MLRRFLFACAALVAVLGPGMGCRHSRNERASDRCDSCTSRGPAATPGMMTSYPTTGSPPVSVAGMPAGYVPGSAVVISDTGNPAFASITYPVGEPTPLQATATAASPSGRAPANELPLPKIPAPGVPEAPVLRGANPPLTPIAPARTTGELRR
jgi:hypothetical protein